MIMGRGSTSTRKCHIVWWIVSLWISQGSPILVVAAASGIDYKNHTVGAAFSASDVSSTTTDDNEECRAYVLQFLNGTTDEHDQCTAFHNAYAAGGCPSSDRDPAIENDDFVNTVTEECCHNMERFYLRFCTSSDASPSSIIMGIACVLLLCAGARAVVVDYLKWNWLPDACVFILVGATFSTINMLVLTKESTMVYDHFYFEEDFFLQVLLPPTIFQAALSIDKPSFARHFGPIVLFAIVGTTLSSVLIGIMTHWMTSGYLPMLESLVFGALISSIDPVATLGILGGVGVDPTSTLYALIFGESLLNDGVAIVLFDTLQSHLGEDDSILADPTMYISLVQDFVIILIGSMAAAIVLGALAIFYFVCLRGRQVAVAEVASFFAWALIPYYVSEALGFSGIIAILAMGFIMDFFILGCSGGHGEATAAASARVSSDESSTPITLREIMAGHGRLLSTKCCVHIGFIAHAIAATMETIIFAYLGLFVFDDKVYSMALEQVAIWTCVISRAIMVIMLSWLINNWMVSSCCKKEQGNNHNNQQSTPSSPLVLDRKTQTMLFLAGIRGAVSFALVSKLPVYDMVTQQGTQYKAELKAMTSTAIICTLFVFGILAYFVVDRSPPSASTAAGDAVQFDDCITSKEPLLTSSSPGDSKHKDYGATKTSKHTVT